MGTSNWQQIPFCVEAMMRIEPERVLDIGVGFGRWGMVAREFCDVWFGRVLRSQWKVRVEGVEAFPKNIDAYHAHFYDKIHLGDLRDFLPQFNDRWNLIIFGDVLEHFEKYDGTQLLRWATELSDYVLVNIPLGENWPQEDSYDNPYERHLSEWTADEFEPFGLRRQASFRDFGDRPFGSFILSQHDPRGLEHRLFSRSTVSIGGILPVDSSTVAAGAEPADAGQLQARIETLVADWQQAKEELTELKGSIGFRVLSRVQRSRAFPLLHRAAQALMRWRSGLRPKTSAIGPNSWASQFVAKGASRSWQFVQGDPEHPVVAICHPRWPGARSAAEGQTPNLLLTPETGPPEIEAIVACLATSRATHFIVDGFYRGYAALLRLMKKRMPRAEISYLHHGSFFQMIEDPSLPALLAADWATAARGRRRSSGFLQTGHGRSLRATGSARLRGDEPRSATGCTSTGRVEDARVGVYPRRRPVTQEPAYASPRRAVVPRH